MISTLLDHAGCPPAAHRKTADTSIGETGDDNGRMVCLTCGKPFLHCQVALAIALIPADLNDDDHHGYEPQYVHVNDRHHEECPA